MTPLRLLALLVILATLPLPARGGAPFLDGERGVLTVAPILKGVTPAVVNIAVVTRAPVESNPLFRDPFFRRFFDLPERPTPRETQSAGSGVIVDSARGWVLTNHHVVENATEITVTLKDGRALRARLLGSDPETDIAVLEVPPEDLSALPFGNSDTLQVGDVVIAIGNPFGLGQTVTSGIVSALGRSGLGIEGYEDFIQTDASINPGNSGGALVDSQGRLIGINTAIIGPGGGNVGIGFAVPVNMARAVMDQLVEHGAVRRGAIGVAVQDLTPDIADALGLPRRQGAMVVHVAPRSPAAEAGLRSGDVVLAIDGRPIRDGEDLRNKIGLVRAGTEVSLTLSHKGEKRTVAVRVSQRNGNGRGGEAEGDVLVWEFAGALFAPLPGDAAGVLVGRVDPSGRAARAGLARGDLVLGVNGKAISGVRQMAATVDAASGPVALMVARNGQRFVVVLP